MIYTFDPYEDYPWKEALKEMYADGVRNFSFLYPLVLAWQEDGSFDFHVLDELTDEILSLTGDVRLLPRTFLTTPDWWDARYEEELLRFDGPPPRVLKFHRATQKLWKYEDKMYHAVRNPSIASEIWRHDASRALEACAAHLLERYGLSKILGIQLAYGTCGEWGQFGSYTNGQFANADFSRPMVTAYRNYLMERYGNREEFHTIMPPSKEERMRTEYGMLRSPRFYRRQLDYFVCYAKTQLETVQCFARAVKRVHPELKTGSFGTGLMPVGVSAYQLHQIPSSLQGLGLAEIPELDFVSTPNGYWNRGQGMYSQAPERSVSLRKTFIAECDVRTAYTTDCYFPASSSSLDQFLFETGYNLTTGSGCFWLYDFGKHWYRDDDVRAAVRRLAQICASESGKIPQAEIALVIDPESVPCSEGSTGYYRNFLDFLTRELPRGGVPFDSIVMDDFFTAKPYKLYIFRDKFLCDPEQAVRIRRFLEKHGASAIWFGPAGAVSPESVDFASSEILTGFSIRSVPDVIAPNYVTFQDHPLLEKLPLPYSMSPVENWNTVYAPVLTGSGGEVLGLVESTGLPGCLLRRSEGRFDLWSAFPLLPAELLRSLYSLIGIVPRVEGPAVCYGAGGCFVLRADEDAELQVRTANASLINLITGEICPASDGKVRIPVGRGQTLLLCESTSSSAACSGTVL